MSRLVSIVFVIVIAAVVTVAIYFFTQEAVAVPLCRQAAGPLGWKYDYLQAPDLLVSGQNRTAANVVRDPTCVFRDAQNGLQYKRINQLSGSPAKDLLISLGLQIDLVFVVMAVVLMLIAARLTGVSSRKTA